MTEIIQAGGAFLVSFIIAAAAMTFFINLTKR